MDQVETFRLLHRLFAQIERLLAVNNIAAVTTDLVDAAVRASSSAAPLTFKLLVR